MNDGTVFKYYYSKVVDTIEKIYWWQDTNKDRNTKILIKLVKWYYWELEHRDNLPDLIAKIEDEKQTTKYVRDQLNIFTNENDTLKNHIVETKKKHEEEIIRLKDLVQAKQVQIDKFLEQK